VVMETDLFFYQLLKQLPETLFQLLGLPAEKARAYRFDSVEVKKSFRIDGCFCLAMSSCRCTSSRYNSSKPRGEVLRTPGMGCQGILLSGRKRPRSGVASGGHFSQPLRGTYTTGAL